MEQLKLKQRLYNFFENNNRLELEDLQKEASKLQQEITQEDEKLSQKKRQIEAVKGRFQIDENEKLDLQFLTQNSQYLATLEDEFLNDQLVSKALVKRHRIQLAQIKDMYQKTKLYEKMNEKNNAEIAKILEKTEEKHLEELACQSYKEVMLHE